MSDSGNMSSSSSLTSTSKLSSITRLSSDGSDRGDGNDNGNDNQHRDNTAVIMPDSGNTSSGSSDGNNQHPDEFMDWTPPDPDDPMVSGIAFNFVEDAITQGIANSATRRHTSGTIEDFVDGVVANMPNRAVRRVARAVSDSIGSGVVRRVAGAASNRTGSGAVRRATIAASNRIGSGVARRVAGAVSNRTGSGVARRVAGAVSNRTGSGVIRRFAVAVVVNNRIDREASARRIAGTVSNRTGSGAVRGAVSAAAEPVLQSRQAYLSSRNLRGTLASNNPATLRVARQQDDTCPICMEDMKEADPATIMVIMVCGHRFHHECIQGWFNVRNACHGTCPIDRQKLFTNPGHENCNDLHEGIGFDSDSSSEEADTSVYTDSESEEPESSDSTLGSPEPSEESDAPDASSEPSSDASYVPVRI